MVFGKAQEAEVRIEQLSALPIGRFWISNSSRMSVSNIRKDFNHQRVADESITAVELNQRL